MIECPFCLAPVHSEAVACRSCGRDLTGHMYVLRRLEALTDTLARLVETVPAGSEQSPPAPRARPGSIGQLAVFAIAPVALLMVAHYLTVFALDLRPAWLLSATLLVPAAFGAAVFGKAKQRLGFWLISFLGSAVAAVIGMNLVTAAVVADSSPLLPEDPQAWRETIQFTASIFLGFLSGYLIAYLLLSLRYPAHERIRRANDEFRAVSGHLFTATSAASVERAGKYLASLMSLVSATGAIYFGIQRF